MESRAGGFMEGKRAFVTGDRGFIASFLCPCLIQKGWEVWGMDQRGDPPTEWRSFSGDVRREEDLLKASRGATVLFHLAAAHADFGITEKQYFEVNLGGTSNSLKACARNGIKTVVFFSSVAVYGRGNCPKETDEPRPESPYGKSKLAAEKQIQRWVEEDSERRALIIRPTVVFGPRNTANMYNLIRNVLSGRFRFVGKGDNIKSVAYVENLVEAVLFLLEKPLDRLDIYNYTDLPDMTVRQLVTSIAEIGGVEVSRHSLPKAPAFAAGFLLDLFARVTGLDLPVTGARMRKFLTETRFDSSKIREKGFTQPITLLEGLRRTVDWIKAQAMAGKS